MNNAYFNAEYPFKIERGMKIPPKSKGPGAPSMYASACVDMAVGDSILFERAAQASYMLTVMKRYGMLAESRKLANGYRVWRTA